MTKKLKKSDCYDICVMGAGMVGAALALSLAHMGLRIVLVDANRVRPYAPDDPPELRVSALNMHSVELLKSLGVWQHVISKRCKAYTRLKCWENNSAVTTFDASSIGLTQLGYFVENRILQVALWEKIESQQNIRLLTEVKASHIDTSNARVTLDTGEMIDCQVIIGADGARSQVRESCNIGVTGWQYQQIANVFTVSMHKPHEAMTWQRFTPDGPLAFLPMHDNFASLVWYSNKMTSDRLNMASASDKTDMIRQQFPSDLTDFTLLSSGRFPLTRQHANRYSYQKAVIVGDAAHTINPLAGQGVNLGFKDVSALSNSLHTFGLSELSKAFKQYECQRRPQNLLMMSAMDAIYIAFSNRNTALKLIRNLGLTVADRAGPLKTVALKYAVGLD